MSRRHSATARKVLPDAKFGNVVVTKFINSLMYDGKKSVSESIVYNAFDTISKKTKRDPLEVFQEALENLKPQLEVRSRRVGGATYQVPVEVRPARAQAVALRWLVNAARSRKEKEMEERVANELLDILNKRGIAMKKREDTHKMAESNKAFAHFRW
ncbi:MAG: 30S ribosomal protein S7 [Rickettsiales bacterium]|nr:30S ribosomal protein S7 [Rickettsiales bacterium]